MVAAAGRRQAACRESVRSGKPNPIRTTPPCGWAAPADGRMPGVRARRPSQFHRSISIRTPSSSSSLVRASTTSRLRVTFSSLMSRATGMATAM